MVVPGTAWAQVDPFFAPVTEEEREEFGEEGQGVGAPNLARRLIDSVRRRKGLALDEKVSPSAEAPWRHQTTRSAVYHCHPEFKHKTWLGVP